MPPNIENKIPKEVREISSVLTAAGFENYLVGGCVRDLILGREPKDWDITTRATPEEIQKLFPDSFYENAFGTVGVKTRSEVESLKVVEVTPYRLESEYADSRHPNQVSWADKIEEDLARRDFTVNAIALNINSNIETRNSKQSQISNFQNSKIVSDFVLRASDFIDPYGGQDDIQKKLIKTVGKPDERFGEDALRILRALRLSSELGFAIEHETQQSIEKNADLLENISKERIRDEFIKIIMSETPAIALDMSARLNVLRHISPELEKGIGVEQNQAHAYTVWEHLLRSLDHAAKKGFPLHVRLSALFHDIAKPHTKAIKNGQPTFYGHEVVGARLTKKILEDLRFPKEIIDKVYRIVRWHMFFSDTEAITLSAVRRMVRNVGPELIWDLMDMRAADRIGTGRPKEAPYRLRKYHAMVEQVMRDPISVKQLVVNGEDIMKLTGTSGGPHIGAILEILLSEVLEAPEKNTKEYLETRVAELHALEQSELLKLGKTARDANAGEEEKEVEKIKGEYGVK